MTSHQRRFPHSPVRSDLACGPGPNRALGPWDVPSAFALPFTGVAQQGPDHEDNPGTPHRHPPNLRSASSLAVCGPVPGLLLVSTLIGKNRMRLGTTRVGTSIPGRRCTPAGFAVERGEEHAQLVGRVDRGAAPGVRAINELLIRSTIAKQSPYCRYYGTTLRMPRTAASASAGQPGPYLWPCPSKGVLPWPGGPTTTKHPG